MQIRTTQHISALISAGIILTNSACSKAPEPVATSKQASPGLAAKPSTPSLNDTAAAEAKHCFSLVCLQRGASWLTQTEYTVFDQWEEYNTPQFAVAASNTAADKLNGFEYRGNVRMTATAFRIASIEIGEGITWGKWTDGGSTPRLEFEVVKQNGTWKCLGLQKYKKPDLSKMPPAPN